MTRPAPLLLALALAACAPEPAPPDGTPAPTAGGAAGSEGIVQAPSPPPAPDTLSITRDTEALAERPTAPLRVEGACPFEGCVYGTWTTTEETAVYARPADSTGAAFTVPVGTALEASSGFVLVTRVGVSVVTRPTELFLSYEESTPLAVGDTVRVLDYEGEGSFRVWHDGRIGYSDAGAGIGAPAGADPDAAFRQVVAPEQQWWARVTAPDGRAGWLRMDQTPSVLGADALG